ncbi:MAG: hypothetical protein EPO24_11760 [Bacteroidetes bacterium]|nr:MAG: hypothetical protein EPO24_11760 [Bacteroidota bacterium]
MNHQNVLRTLFFVPCIIFASNLCNAQLRFNLDANIELTAASFNPNRDPERTINTNFRDDDPFNPVRGKLFTHLQFSDMFGIEGEFLFDNKGKRFDRSKGNQQFRMDGLFLSVRGLASNHLNFWLGRVPTPVGTFSARSYSHVNPLIGYPLAYHYKIPYNVFTLNPEAQNLSLRDNNVGAGTAIYEACWITGLTTFGEIEGFTYMLAIGQGTLTNPEAKENGGFQIAGRIGRQVSEEFSVGVSGGIAPYLQHDLNLPAGVGVRDPEHVLAGIDVSVAVKQYRIHFEAFHNSWDTPQYQHETSVRAYTWYLEGQYFILENFYAAARFDQMLYNNITDPLTGTSTPWGYNVNRLEAGLGFSPLDELTIKGIAQQYWLDNPSSNSITILALQAAFRFDHVTDIFDSYFSQPIH